jgi:CHAT domain-containing protein
VAGAAQAVYSKSLGLVDTLVQCGVPVAVGHRWPVLDDDTSVEFVTTFYDTLLETRNPKQAILAARQNTQAHEAHWASAVLVLQEPS